MRSRRVNEKSLHTILLIVEDDEDIGEFLAYVLQDETPYTVLHVPNAAQALAAVTSITPSLFLLDYQLPGMDGLDLSDRLHTIKVLETVPTLMMSANLPPREALQQRHIASLRKPFEISDFLQLVETLLSEQAA